MPHPPPQKQGQHGSESPQDRREARSRPREPGAAIGARRHSTHAHEEWETGHHDDDHEGDEERFLHPTPTVPNGITMAAAADRVGPRR